MNAYTRNRLVGLDDDGVMTSWIHNRSVGLVDNNVAMTTGLHAVDVGDFFSDIGSAVSSAGKWVSNAVNTAGSDIGKAATDISHGNIGDAFKDVGEIGLDVTVLGVVINGFGIKQQVFDDIKKAANTIKGVVPYAQMVISLIPGVGTGISAAIGAGMALAEGQDMTDALLAGVKSALPGGPLAAAAVDAVTKGVEMAVNHEPLNWNTLANDAVGVAGSALGLPDEATKGIETAITATAALCSGTNPAQVLANAAISEAGSAVSAVGPELGKLIPQDMLDSAAKLVPPNLSKTALAPLLKVADTQLQKAVKGMPAEIQKAVQVGLASAVTRQHQARLKPKLEGTAWQQCIAKGKVICLTDKTVAPLYAKLPASQQIGFQGGIGAMRSFKMPAFAFLTLRNSSQLSNDDRTGFDMAVSLHIGQVTSPAKPPSTVPAHPVAVAAYHVTKGMQGAPVTSKLNIMQQLSPPGPAREGAVAAVKEIANSRMTLWQSILHFFGLFP